MTRQSTKGRVAVFYPHNMLASWLALGGYTSTLKRMEYEVLDCPLPGNQVHDVERIRLSLPSVQSLNECDVILVAFAEYVRPWLDAIYGLDTWNKIKKPKILRFDESFCRQDLKHLMIWPELKKWGDIYSFPAAQDADKFGGQFLPYGVDLSMFNNGSESVKKYDVAFIGSLYNIRTWYAQQLNAQLDRDNLKLVHNQVAVVDLSGIRAKESTQLLAENYSSIKVFFCLPPMSQLIVMKAFEVMASGTFLMYPRLPGAGSKNLRLFKDNEHICYYDLSDFKENAKQIKYWLDNDERREEIAKAGQAKVQNDFSLEKFFENLFAEVGVAA